MRKVFLDELPKKGTQRIDWINSVGKNIKFIYDDIEGSIKIIDYKLKSKLVVEYKDKTFEISTSNLSGAKLGRILEVYTSEFKHEVGELLINEKTNMIIVDRFKKERISLNKKIIEKFYVCKCNNCTKNVVVREYDLLSHGCAICTNKIPTLGVNTIWDTHRWLIYDFGLNENFSKTHTYGTYKKGEFTCQHCGNIKIVDVGSVINNKSIGCICGDGFSYPEKFMTSVLNQLKISHKTQLNKTDFEWCDKYKYDFYLSDYNIIIETHGLQHYEYRTGFKITLEEQQKIDEIKQELALKNKIDKYVVIDCRYSEMEWIKNSVLNSELSNMFDLSKIDWLKCEEFALSNLVKQVCELKKNNPDLTTTKIGKIINLSPDNVRVCLKKGSELGWCNYNSQDEIKKTYIKKGQVLSKEKEVKMFQNNMELGIFKSASEIQRISLKRFGTILYSTNIAKVCNKKLNNYKGYYFEYTE